MKRKKMPQRPEIFPGICIIIIVFFFLVVAWIWGNRENWVYFLHFLVMAIIVGMWIPADFIRCKIDQRFDRLEKLLRELAAEQRGMEKEQGQVEKDKRTTHEE